MSKNYSVPTMSALVDKLTQMVNPVWSGFFYRLWKDMPDSWTGTGAGVLQDSPTIVTPTVADLSNMTHDHEDAAGGGAVAYIPESIITAAGGLIYGTGAGALAELAVSANKKLFGNAGGTAPEYAAGMKLGTFSIDMATASGNQAVTGVGFLPSHVVFLSVVHSTGKMSVGFDDGTLFYSVAAYQSTSGPYSVLWQASSLYSIHAMFAPGVTGYVGKINSLDSDGFTIAWTKVGGPTGTLVIYYLAFR